MTWNYLRKDDYLQNLTLLRRNWPNFESLSKTYEVKVKDVSIGGSSPVVIAGPCAVESYEQTLSVARVVKEAGAHLLRGGAFKPRTSPYEFQGLGMEGLEILAEVRKQTGLGIVTEVMDVRCVETVARFADMIQIGTRSMFCYSLLSEVGKTHLPVLLKRNWSATLEEWICAGEYIAKEGNMNIVFCERGIRSSCHGRYARFILDLNIFQPMRTLTPLPVIADPSHATGDWTLVPNMSRAALSAGAHGLLIEVLPSSSTDRETLRCDRNQGISPQSFKEIMAWAQQNQVSAITPFSE